MPEEDSELEVNPMWVRLQFTLSTLEGFRDDENTPEKVNGTLAALSAYYDEMSEEILNEFLEHANVTYADPVVERECRDAINAFHVAGILRITEPYQDTNWLDPENRWAFHLLVNEEKAEFFENIRTQTLIMRTSIEEGIQAYINDVTNSI